VAANLAQNQMFHLDGVSRALVAAGRSPTLDRAVTIPAGPGQITLSPAGPHAYVNVLDREWAIARAVDDRYRALAPAAGPELLDLVTGSGPTHFDALASLGDAIGDPAPAGLLDPVGSSLSTRPSPCCSAPPTRPTAWW